jgi:hypothetical protein
MAHHRGRPGNKKTPELFSAGVFLKSTTQAARAMCLALAATATKALVKAINPAAGVHNLLLAGVKRVTLRAYVNEQVFTQG